MKIQEVQKKAVPILKRKSVKRAGIFGSLARGEASPGDIDMLVEPQRPFGLFALLTLKSELEEALGMKVDLITYNNIKPTIRERILKDEVRIL